MQHRDLLGAKSTKDHPDVLNDIAAAVLCTLTTSVGVANFLYLR